MADQHDLIHLLSQAERQVTQRLREMLLAEGCSLERWRVLQLLGDGKSHSMSELAEFALLPAPTLTRLIDRMVSDNLLYRRIDERDRRRTLVHLTQRGEALCRRVTKAVQRHHTELAAAVGDSAYFGEVLQRLADL